MESNEECKSSNASQRTNMMIEVKIVLLLELINPYILIFDNCFLLNFITAAMSAWLPSLSYCLNFLNECDCNDCWSKWRKNRLM